MLKKRIFVSFAIEDERTRDLFVGQSRNTKTPFDFIDMSVKKPWDEEWKRNCRTRIKGCDGFIVLITKNLKNGSGALWEIKCAIEEGIPLLGGKQPVNRIYSSTELHPIFAGSKIGKNGKGNAKKTRSVVDV